MDPADVGFIKAVVAFIVVATTGFGMVRVWLRVRYPSRTPDQRVLEAAQEENANLRANIEARIAELEERLDFTERRLLQERSRRSLESEAPTPV